jgi:hypothetical protein
METYCTPICYGDAGHDQSLLPYPAELEIPVAARGFCCCVYLLPIGSFYRITSLTTTYRYYHLSTSKNLDLHPTQLCPGEIPSGSTAFLGLFYT